MQLCQGSLGPMLRMPSILQRYPRQVAIRCCLSQAVSRPASTPTLKFASSSKHLSRLEQAAAIGQEAVLTDDAEDAGSRQTGPVPPFMQQQDKPARKRVGALQRAPVVSPADEHLASALKRSSRVGPSPNARNEAEKERSRAARQLDALMKELSVPLTKYATAFPRMAALHPFEAALLDLTLGKATYASTLAKADSLRKALQEVGKAYAGRASKAANKRAATAVAEEGVDTLTRVFTKGAKCVMDLKRMGQQLRALPFVEPSLPTLALVGAPNVGKSSLVKVLSSGTPEVCDYPFTTRSIKMGHFFIGIRKHQVTDTPGLLHRPDHERNKMELLTLAALEHLPTTAVFVADLTEGCGTSVADQWAIRSELRARFPDKPWLDVLSKADLLEDVFAEADARLASSEAAGPGPASAAAAAAAAGGAAHSDRVPAAVSSAVEFAAALQGAVRVSSVTRQGIDALQSEVIHVLSSQPSISNAQLEEGQMAVFTDESSDDNPYHDVDAT